MSKFSFNIVVDAETEAQAQQVIGERTCYDEDYGFPYTITEQDFRSEDFRPEGEWDYYRSQWNKITNPEDLDREQDEDTTVYTIQLAGEGRSNFLNIPKSLALQILKHLSALEQANE